MNTFRSRHPAGSPVGGQFASTHRAEADTTLTDNEAHVDDMDYASPNSYVTRDDAIEHGILPALGEWGDDYDIDALADDVLFTTGEGTQHRYHVITDSDAFWEAAERHDTTAPVIARLVDINIESVNEGRVTVFDRVEVVRNGHVLDTILVDSDEDPGPYDEAVREAGFSTFTWDKTWF